LSEAREHREAEEELGKLVLERSERNGPRAVALTVQLSESLGFSVIPKRYSGGETRLVEQYIPFQENNPLCKLRE
jgi:hypothetical protein